MFMHIGTPRYTSMAPAPQNKNKGLTQPQRQKNTTPFGGSMLHRIAYARAGCGSCGG